MLNQLEENKQLYKTYGTTQPQNEYEATGDELINVKTLVDSINNKIQYLKRKHYRNKTVFTIGEFMGQNNKLKVMT